MFAEEVATVALNVDAILVIVAENEEDGSILVILEVIVFDDLLKLGSHTRCIGVIIDVPDNVLRDVSTCSPREVEVRLCFLYELNDSITFLLFDECIFAWRNEEVRSIGITGGRKVGTNGRYEEAMADVGFRTVSVWIAFS